MSISSYKVQSKWSISTHDFLNDVKLSFSLKGCGKTLTILKVKVRWMIKISKQKSLRV